MTEEMPYWAIYLVTLTAGAALMVYLAAKAYERHGSMPHPFPDDLEGHRARPAFVGLAGRYVQEGKSEAEFLEAAGEIADRIDSNMRHLYLEVALQEFHRFKNLRPPVDTTGEH